MFSAFFFDLDGTLLDSEILWVEATGRVLAACGYSLSAEALLRLVYGRAWSDIFADIRTRYSMVIPDEATLLSDMRGQFVALRAMRDIRIHSSISLLKRLAKDYPVALVSGSGRDEVMSGIAEMGIAPYLRFFLANEDYSPGKPHPACYQLAAEKLGISPAACLVFEDATAGVQAANAAGMSSVALQRPQRPAQDYSAADWITDDLEKWWQQWKKKL